MFLTNDSKKQNVKDNIKHFSFLIAFLAFSLFLHLELYKELFNNTNNVRNCNFSLFKNSSNCSHNENLSIDSNKNPRIYFDIVYGVCVDNCRDDRYLFSVEKSCVPNCPFPYNPSESEQKFCCSPLCLTCNMSNVDQCFSCRYVSFKGICLIGCPFGTVANSKNECISCNETGLTPYYDTKILQCKTQCDSQDVLYTQENFCLEKCPNGMHKSIAGNHCCDDSCIDCSHTNSKKCLFKSCSYNSWYFDISTSACVETCPEDLNTFETLKACVKDCSTLDPTMWAKNKKCCKIGCEECSREDENFCLTCSFDYFFFLNTSQCIFNCPPGYTYSVFQKTCISCEQGAEMCDLKKLDKWCSSGFYLNHDSTCKGYCAKGTPDPGNQFCCNKNNKICQNNKNIGVCERLRLEKVYSPSMQRDVPFFILLPQTWDQNKNDTFPVVMIFHSNGNSYVRFLLFVKEVMQFGCYNKDFLLVFPDGDRNSFFTNPPLDSRVRFETFFSSEIRHFLIQNYRAQNNRKWAMIGVSGGGFGAIEILLKHSDKFCAAASYSAPFVLYNMTQYRDPYIESRFGNKTTEFKNYIPFNITWIAENMGLQNNTTLNIFFIYYNTDQYFNQTPANSRQFHNYLESKNISHTFEEKPGAGHTEGWENQTVNEIFPFILNAFKNNCE